MCGCVVGGAAVEKRGVIQAGGRAGRQAAQEARRQGGQTAEHVLQARLAACAKGRQRLSQPTLYCVEHTDSTGTGT